MIKQITVDENTCIGCGSCTIVAPDAFEINAKGMSEPKENALKTVEDTLLKAAQVCPVKAISLTDEAQTKIHPKD